MWLKMEKHMFKRSSTHNATMAHTLFSRSSASRPARPRLVAVNPSGHVETIISTKESNGFSPAIRSRVERAKQHYSELGAEDVCKHSLRVLRAAVQGKLLDPNADESDMLSMELADQILYHSLTSEGHLPNEGHFSSRFHDAFQLQRTLNDLDSAKGERSSSYVELLNDPSNDLTNLLIAFYTRIADSMTIHDRETLKASATKMPGIFPVHGSWAEVQQNMAAPMLNIYCPVADWGGQTRAYREMRDNAVYYLQPDRFRGVARHVRSRMEALEKANKFLMGLISRMATRLGLRVITAPDYRVVSRAFDSIGPGTVAVALKPFKGVGGLLRKSDKKSVPVDNVHDWSGLTVITADEKQMYDAVNFLHSEGVGRVASEMNLRSIRLCEVEDHAANPKPVTNYQSVHIDTETSAEEMVPVECIVRTLKMHKKADEGEASHDRYKESPLVNGERKRFEQRLAEITSS
ncbi:hypothetical protein GF318_05660 [Candidatus Micrarchaeota archaeon]|nr:hypothetical protein [Candidatus Micrarchaeota archaeon]